MLRFAISELTDIHFTYGLADGNALMTRYIKSRLFTNARMFLKLHRKLHGIVPNSSKCANRTVRKPELHQNAVILNVSHLVFGKDLLIIYYDRIIFKESFY